MQKIILPVPPSANHAWVYFSKMFSTRVLCFISPKYRQFREDVKTAFLAQGGKRDFKKNQRLKLTLFFYFGDNRKRDIDNYIKPTQDALMYAGAIWDDSAFDHLQIIRKKVKIKQGKTICKIGLLN